MINWLKCRRRWRCCFCRCASTRVPGKFESAVAVTVAGEPPLVWQASGDKVAVPARRSKFVARTAAGPMNCLITACALQGARLVACELAG